ncbi:hypothetical protein [Abyssogena phaseoliformis symbiont]|uniref:hypothetical protein n=1 Tax=Abyssogena phaseoliformis symbiont TaxID=596095 RepID=UPI001CEDDFB2|nr:hypothetical protein [Abyssogena phaseoliformis symbiont]
MPINTMSTAEVTNDKVTRLRLFGWLLIILINIKAKNTISYKIATNTANEVTYALTKK